ncbi:MAG: response regulator transcription factor [Lewinellaceae bacterium]|nr:response regulator transcription factor [Phaeodactylibacter sp.]MCB9347286.1 response regulator transcription factor [Lewinellaceae bacterium]
MIRIGIIDDDPLVREEIIFLLQCHPHEFELAFEAASMGQFFELLQLDHKPDIVLLDISLAEQDSLDQIGKLKRLLPAAKVVIITGHTEPEYLLKALQKGALGYFVKSSRPERILDVIRDTHKGGAFIEPQMASSLLGFFRPEEKKSRPLDLADSEALQRLGIELHRREIEVAKGLSSGLSYKEIAAMHNVGLNTVRHYVKSLYKKLGIASKQELVNLLNTL